MNIQPLHADFICPSRSTEFAGGYDIYMPTAGKLGERETIKFNLGFAAQVPAGHVALLLPRSGAGAKFSLELNNTCGVIDHDYTGEWMATLRTKNGNPFCWAKGERVLQFVLVQISTPELITVESLTKTTRGAGGFGSTGK
jgi:dUTP pyrophosphatase